MAPSEIPVFELPPEVTTDRIDAIEEDAHRALGSEGAHLVVDLSRTTFMCSSGLGMLVKLSKRLHERGGAIALARPAPSVARLLKSVGLTAVLPDFATVEAATGRLRDGRTAKTP